MKSEIQDKSLSYLPFEIKLSNQSNENSRDC
jgi:hypothetical protein